ncbi:MAG TPA: hypothetical protein DDY78_07610 [Planctomycetales bacterium]|nr:hypothetical protein [Planctomycetales bacterium]
MVRLHILFALYLFLDFKIRHKISACYGKIVGNHFRFRRKAAALRFVAVKVRNASFFCTCDNEDV